MEFRVVVLHSSAEPPASARHLCSWTYGHFPHQDKVELIVEAGDQSLWGQGLGAADYVATLHRLDFWPHGSPAEFAADGTGFRSISWTRALSESYLTFDHARARKLAADGIDPLLELCKSSASFHKRLSRVSPRLASLYESELLAAGIDSPALFNRFPRSR